MALTNESQAILLLYL